MVNAHSCPLTRETGYIHVSTPCGRIIQKTDYNKIRDYIFDKQQIMEDKKEKIEKTSDVIYGIDDRPR